MAVSTAADAADTLKVALRTRARSGSAGAAGAPSECGGGAESIAARSSASATEAVATTRSTSTLAPVHFVASTVTSSTVRLSALATTVLSTVSSNQSWLRSLRADACPGGCSSTVRCTALKLVVAPLQRSPLAQAAHTPASDTKPASQWQSVLFPEPRIELALALHRNCSSWWQYDPSGHSTHTPANS